MRLLLWLVILRAKRPRRGTPQTTQHARVWEVEDEGEVEVEVEELV